MTVLVTINQDTDTPARREVTPGAVLTYLYDRSRDSRLAGTPGQDFIAYACDAHAQRIAFAVCDGVSQSFYGDLAARFLGEWLVAWLVESKIGDDFGARVESALREWTTPASELVRSRPIGDSVAPLVRDALERKRDAGSESMFVAGLVDLAGGQLAVCWMGDMRLWLWDASGEQIELPGAAWITRERWSTRTGPRNGSPRTAVLPLRHIARITVHSDGVGNRAEELATVTLDRLNALAATLAAAPASDDVSILDIALTHVEAPALPAPAPFFPDEAEPVLRWEPVPGAEWYRVQIDADPIHRTVDVSGTTFFIHPEAIFATRTAPSIEFRVQALANDRAPGPWSAPRRFIRPEAAPTREEAAPAFSARRPLPVDLLMALALVLALILSIAWIVVFLR